MKETQNFIVLILLIDYNEKTTFRNKPMNKILGTFSLRSAY